MSRLVDVCVLVSALAGLVAKGDQPNSSLATRPNFLFILADDLGWGDLSCYGNQQFRTPALDRLAAEGILFTQYYQAGSVCSPSRAALLTSRYPAELRLHGHLATPEQNAARGMPNFMDPSVPTLAQLLRQAGYRTIHIGKWHLGRPDPKVPSLEAYGFDTARWIDCQEGERNLWRLEERPRATAILVDATIEALRQVQDQPFYCQLWLHDPHAPLNPPAELMEKFRRQTPQRFTSPFMVYAATVVEMDRQIGRLFQAMDQMGLRDNTVVIFSSDNGPEDIQIANAAWSGVGSAGPLRGRKRSLYEGGIRVPFIVRWPAGAPAGIVDTSTVIGGVDFLPTVCELAGVPIPEEMKATLRGESMAEAFRGKPQERQKPLFWEWRFRVFNHPWNRCPILAIREGPWKLLMNPDGSRMELYNILEDPGEQNNLAPYRPELVEKLSQQLLDWQRTLPAGPVEPAAGRNDYPWPSPKTMK
ncbi:MAG: sulfatase-like hydrolase/transferase [Thermoguttaceae bacterium]|nr:sulfatase-like hydrolase/transferase [Thermoguttaceae bacterium]MDW8078176.1 sulfatase-like hydrolase/transferase [Thermoguttaceae bacterium]